MKPLNHASCPALNRRDFLWHLGGGLGGIAMTHLLTRESISAGLPVRRPEFNGGLHHRARVKRVIQLFMNGGVSQMDTFDPKPELTRLHGQMIGPKEKPEGFTGEVGAVMKSPFEFKQYGDSGRWVSSVFPHQAKCVDDMAFLMAMTTKTNVHGPGSYMQNTGFLLPGFPCMGAWISYALGNLTDNLPTFVVLPDPKGFPYNNQGNFSSAFLPVVHQGTIIKANSPNPIADLKPPAAAKHITTASENEGLSLLEQMNRDHAQRHPGDTRLEARIASYELAAKMQLAAPEALDLSRETPATQRLYGLDEKRTEPFGRNC